MPNAWPTVTATKTHLDASTDDPSQAHAELASAVDKINEIIAAIAYASGVCDLDASTLIPKARLPAATGVNEYIAATGLVNVLAIAPSPAITAYAAGQAFRVKVNITNTGAATLNVNTLGAKAIINQSGTAMAAGQLAADGVYILIYDGTSFQLQTAVSVSAATTSAAGIVELATAAETLTGTDSNRAITPAGFAGNISIGANGYYKLPFGLIIQWGYYTGGSSNPTITFPVAFSTACYSVTLTATSPSSDTTSADATSIHYAHLNEASLPGTISFSARCSYEDSTDDVIHGSTVTEFYWIAIGK